MQGGSLPVYTWRRVLEGGDLVTHGHPEVLLAAAYGQYLPVDVPIPPLVLNPQPGCQQWPLRTAPCASHVRQTQCHPVLWRKQHGSALHHCPAAGWWHTGGPRPRLLYWTRPPGTTTKHITMDTEIQVSGLQHRICSKHAQWRWNSDWWVSWPVAHWWECSLYCHTKHRTWYLQQNKSPWKPTYKHQDYNMGHLLSYWVCAVTLE